MNFNKLSIKNAILISISLLLIISFLLIINVQVFNFNIAVASFISHFVVLIIVLFLNAKYVKRPKRILLNKKYYFQSALIAFVIAASYIFIIDDKEDFEVNVYDVISSVFLAAIFEEIIYRKIILKGLLNKYSKLTAVVISSALFATSHLDTLLQPSKLFLLLIISGFSCWLFIKTKNITNCIILHACYNLGVIFFPKAILLLQ